MLKTRESISLNADIRDASNNQKVMLHATYSATSLSLNVDVLDADYVRETTKTCRRDVKAFLFEPANGLPTWGFRAK